MEKATTKGGSVKEFFDAFDHLEWSDLHLRWLDTIGARLKERMYADIIRRVQVLLQADPLPAEMKEALLTQLDDTATPFGSWAYVYVLLRQKGINPDEISLEEALILIGYELDKEVA